MVVYVLIRKLDENGKAMIAINIPWKNCPYFDTASVPESDYSNTMVRSGSNNISRASHRKPNPLKAILSISLAHSR
jgi:hypothetical protein